MAENKCKEQSNLAEQVLYSFYITQFLLLAISAIVLWWQGKRVGNFFSFDDIHMWAWGMGAGMVILIIEAVLMVRVPESWLDDGGINRLLFHDRSWFHILMIAMIAAVSEELFFRGVLQDWLGIWLTSVIFVLLHTRYLKKWLLVAVVFAISVGFGVLTEYSGDLAPAVIAHGLVDFVLGLYIKNRAVEKGDTKT